MDKELSYFDLRKQIVINMLNSDDYDNVEDLLSAIGWLYREPLSFCSMTRQEAKEIGIYFDGVMDALNSMYVKEKRVDQWEKE